MVGTKTKYDQEKQLSKYYGKCHVFGLNDLRNDIVLCVIWPQFIYCMDIKGKNCRSTVCFQFSAEKATVVVTYTFN